MRSALLAASLVTLIGCGAKKQANYFFQKPVAKPTVQQEITREQSTQLSIVFERYSNKLFEEEGFAIQNPRNLAISMRGIHLSPYFAQFPDRPYITLEYAEGVLYFADVNQDRVIGEGDVLVVDIGTNHQSFGFGNSAYALELVSLTDSI
jgi:hypothetical protein